MIGRETPTGVNLIRESRKQKTPVATNNNHRHPCLLEKKIFDWKSLGFYSNHILGSKPTVDVKFWELEVVGAAPTSPAKEEILYL